MPAAQQRKKGRVPQVKKHHGFLALIILCGWLVPPLAVVIRFGIGIDFFLNVIFTCMGYFPGHFHNYFIQNIRNNRGKGRTPKWALKAGLVEDDTAYMKSTRQWNNRYEQQNARNAYEDDNVPEEDEYGNPIERAIVEHGRHPAQPSAGFGDDGNETARTARQDDLLAGLPDEERDARRKAKKNQRTEYGSGFDDEYTTQQDSAASRRQKDSLLYDLEDGDATLYGGGKSGGSTLSQARAKSGKQKKSERYGLAPDHRDLNGSSSGSLRNGSSGRSSKGRQQSSGSDRYDVVDNSNGSRRRAGGEDDFLNHQF